MNSSYTTYTYGDVKCDVRTTDSEPKILSFFFSVET